MEKKSKEDEKTVTAGRIEKKREKKIRKRTIRIGR